MKVLDNPGEYLVVAENSVYELVNEVNRLTSEGFKPLGGVSICQRHTDYTYQLVQAMWKEV